MGEKIGLKPYQLNNLTILSHVHDLGKVGVSDNILLKKGALTKEEWEGVYKLRDEKYGNWDWNFGRSPKFNIQRDRRFPVGEVDLRLYVDKGVIQEITIFGDFFGKEPVKELEIKLTGLRYDKAELTEALKDVDITQFFGDVPKDEFLDLLYGADEDAAPAS